MAVLTLRQAVASRPETQWTDANGELWTTDEVLNQWKKEQLDEVVVWSEGPAGAPELKIVDVNGRVSEQPILTMEPPSGADIPSEPAVQIEE
ncbi:MAG: hypothetical protein ACRDFS_09555 [Chloroflexota bacterium]